MSTRRRVLIGSATAIGAGLVAYEARKHPTLLGQFLERSPDYVPPDHHVTTTSGSFQSRHMRRVVRWRVSHPSTPAAATVFCLHGKGGNHDRPFDEQRLPDAAAENDLPLAFAGVDGGHSYWHPRQDGTDALAMFVDEFIPLVEDMTKTAQRAVLGWSMGGFGALLAAETYPEKFRAVAAFSPALWQRASDCAPGAFDSSEDFRRHDVFAGRSKLTATKVFIACGADDPFYANSRAFAEGLRGPETRFGNGFHDAAYWRSEAPTALRFLGAALALTAATPDR